MKARSQPAKREVYVLQHENPKNEDVKFIGVYSSKAAARAAIQRLGKQPGFSKTIEGFHIDTYEVDKDHWTEGYVTV
jgi:homoserine kinase type II